MAMALARNQGVYSSETETLKRPVMTKFSAGLLLFIFIADGWMDGWMDGWGEVPLMVPLNAKARGEIEGLGAVVVATIHLAMQPSKPSIYPSLHRIIWSSEKRNIH